MVEEEIQTEQSVTRAKKKLEQNVMRTKLET
jgi:hypothetical protein